MTMATIFWFLMLVSLFFGSGISSRVGVNPKVGSVSGWAMTFILLALLGWSEFGPIIKSGG